MHQRMQPLLLSHIHCV